MLNRVDCQNFWHLFLYRLNFDVMVNEKAKKKVAKKGSRVKSSEVKIVHPVRSKVSNGVHKNIRCRNCLIIDGYSEGEKVCRYCGAKLFLLDRGWQLFWDIQEGIQVLRNSSGDLKKRWKRKESFRNSGNTTITKNQVRYAEGKRNSEEYIRRVKVEKSTNYLYPLLKPQFR